MSPLNPLFSSSQLTVAALRQNNVELWQCKIRECIFKKSTGCHKLSGGLGICCNAINPDKNNCCVPLWCICFCKGPPSEAALQFSWLSLTLLARIVKKPHCELESTLVDLGVGRRMGVGVLTCSMMNRRTACSNLPRGPAVKLTSLAAWCCPLRRSPSVAFARGRRALPLCFNGDKSWADCLFGEGVWTAHKSIKSIRVLRRDGLAWPGLRELGPIFREGLCESVLPQPTVMTRVLTTPVWLQGGGVKSLHMARASVSHLGYSSHWAQMLTTMNLWGLSSCNTALVFEGGIY